VEPSTVRARFGTVNRSALVIVLLIACVAGCGSAPAPSSPAIPQPVVAGARDPLFELQIEAGQERYSVGQPISVSTRLMYVGPLPEITVWGGTEPVLVALEQVDGPFDPGGGSDLVCARTVMKARVPIDAPYQKSGGFSGDDPMANQYRAFFADRAVRLPAGTYRFTATADIYERECGGVPHNLKAAITIAVTP
jgi:hypothetical protein